MNAQDAIVSQIERLLVARTSPLVVAIDGPSGAGKSTLARQVASRVGAAVVEGDDFYAGGSAAEWDTRTPAENADRCIDWRRLRSEALEPLLTGREASWHAFDWHAGHGLAERPPVCSPEWVIIVDGVYSASPALADLVGLTVLVDVPPETRRRRLSGREGDKALDEWYRRWDEAEAYYFEQVCPPSCFDLVVENDRDTAS